MKNGDGSGWESNPPLPALRSQPPVLKTGAPTGTQPLPPTSLAETAVFATPNPTKT